MQYNIGFKPKNRLALATAFLASGFFLFNSVSTKAAPPPVDPNSIEEWDSDMSLRMQKKLRWVGNLASDAIFNAIDTLRIFKLSVPGGGSIQMNIERRIFDNQDVLGSWTVLDRIRVPIRVPLYNYSLPIGGNLSLFFNVGFLPGIELLNIRQVLPKDYWRLPTVEEQKSSIAESEHYRNALSDSSTPSPTTIERDSDINGETPWHAFDPLFRARYSKYWNFLRFPMRIPLHASGLSKLENNEIISYTGSGTLEVGGGVGWTLDPTSFVSGADASISMRTYLRGEYRISILKENDRYVRVKVTRVFEKGVGSSIGSSSRVGVIEGLMVFGKSFNYRLSVTPFQIDVNEATGQSFDVGYRYDLQNAAARAAYEKAVTLRFGDSEDLSKKPIAGPEIDPEADADMDRPVQRIFDRTSEYERKTFAHALRLIIIKKNMADENTCTDSKVIFPDGTHKIFQCIADNYSDWRWLWGAGESSRNQFTVLLNKDTAATGASDSFGLWVDGVIEDSFTTGGELSRYIDRIETVIGKTGVFPKPPILLPYSAAAPTRLAEKNSLRKFNRDSIFGRSSFYFRLSIDRPGLEKFIHFPENQRWSVLENAFGVKPGVWSTQYKRNAYRSDHIGATILNAPLYLANLNLRLGSMLDHADEMYTHWKEADEAPDLESQSRALSDLFSNALYSNELVYILKYALKDQEIGYNVTGKSSAFGQIIDQGKRVPQDPVSEAMRREIEFDRPDYRRNQDMKALVNQLKIVPKDSRFIEVSFKLDQLPRFLYFKLSLKPDGRWGKKTKEELVEINRGRFKVGENVLTLDRNAPADTTDANGSSLEAKIASKIVQGEEYELTVGITRDSRIWGPVSTESFRALSEQ